MKITVNTSSGNAITIECDRVERDATGLGLVCVKGSIDKRTVVAEFSGRLWESWVMLQDDDGR